MNFRRAVVAGTMVLLAAVAVTAARARADELYAVSGRDVFSVGNGDVHSETAYTGRQRLAIRRAPDGITYTARVEYDKDGDGGKQHAVASYAATLLPSGEMRDGAAHDPDYLTVLNQPFSVQLDAQTMRDLGHVKRAVPFDFPSPMTGAPLRGTLRRLPDSIVSGVRSMGIAFEAAGPLHGALPEKPTVALAGTIKMKGTAYYAYASALLVSLDATLAIDGNIDDSARRAPVSIVYTRSIRSGGPLQTARTPPPRPS